MIEGKLLERFRVTPGKAFSWKDHDPGWKGTPILKKLGKDDLKKEARKAIEKDLHQLAEAQQLLWASDTYAVLLVLQAMDAAGKDGIIKHVMSGLNPQGCQVYSFKKPTDEELNHDFLWRYARCLPERGRIGIFNRSYYEEVLVVKVHREILEHERLPKAARSKALWEERYEDINHFEQHLVRNGTVVLKFFLNISRGEQKKRFLQRLDESDKHWKFSAADLAERAYWDDYQKAYAEALTATSTEWAPWYVIPSDHKWVSRALVADILTKTIEQLPLHYPKPTEEQEQLLAAARKQLEAE